MIKIEPSLYSIIKYKDEYISNIQTIINHENETEHDITVYYSGFSDDHENEHQDPERIFWSICVDFFDNSFEKQRFEDKNISSEHFIGRIYSLVKRVLKALSCNHECIVRKTYNDRAFPDGSGICEICGVEAKTKDNPYFFEPIDDGTRVLKEGMGTGKYVTKYLWPQDTGLQYGNRGIVFSKKDSYETAFFEAFPTISGKGTFIRGEGATPDKAEDKAWKTYQKYLNCPEHEFTRMHRGKHRTDGCGVCVHCGMFSTDALEPETKCVVCDIPTNNKSENGYICIKHDIDRPFEEHLKEALEIEKKMAMEGEVINESEVYFNTLIEHKAQAKMIDYIDNDRRKNDEILRYCHHFEHSFNGAILNLKAFSIEKETFNFPNEKDSAFSECLDYFIDNLPVIVESIKVNKTAPTELFLPAKYYKKENK
jgi:hypothetical protein